MATEQAEEIPLPASSSSSEDEEEEGGEPKIESWDDWESEDEESSSSGYCLCLFCDSRFGSAGDLFEHCASNHCFDFRGVVADAGLDFYGSVKLINYVRAQVTENKCWSCDLTFECNKELQDHLHKYTLCKKDGKFLWEDDMYLTPTMVDDALLHSFACDEDDEDFTASISKEELMRELMNNEGINDLSNGIHGIDRDDSELDIPHKIERKETHGENMSDHSGRTMSNDIIGGNTLGELHQKQKDKSLRVSFANIAAREIKTVNENYFGAYGSFGIHREMISDKVRTDAYREALLHNPSLMKQATVLDVGCGTGILSLFAAQAGASRVISVEASAKMASVATQIAKDNGLLSEQSEKGEGNRSPRVINVVHSMVEELEKFMHIPPQSIDVLVSEWMGYCLLYESMLSSVLYARDHWLKPGGAILPDTATIFVAGFGRGGTSLPFWEDVYGFDMSSIGKEVMEDAAHLPIVDVLDSRDIVTDTAALHSLDLATMKPDEIDFTATTELELKSGLPEDAVDGKSKTCWCHGLVLWFETGFTSRFCKEKSIILSTSPYTTKTHWCQTILTFQEPIAMTTSTKLSADPAGVVGTEECPVVRIKSRISIVRSSQHRSIDISMETTGIGADGRKRTWPVQIFNM
ncbi:putative protein arginine N-methyltransferase 3 [Iris pallida]|uniref:C2H2-type domain-containing protein n=1 Tax=Iris pallida TaxID=29817 RepID=A0AAX6FQ09_IRIPA|nr:putative protein arginine N-methyltransferase 3 [Iris pallida]